MNPFQLHTSLPKRVFSWLLPLLLLIVNAQYLHAQTDTLVIFTNDNQVYKSVEAYKNRFKPKEIESERFDLKKGKVNVYEGTKKVAHYAFTNGIGKVEFPITPGKTYVVKVEGENCYPPIVYELKTEGYDREGTKVVGFGKRYKRSFNVDWNLYSAGHTFQSPTPAERKLIDSESENLQFIRYFKFAKLAKRFRPDSLGVLISSQFSDAQEFHENILEERREERQERREEKNTQSDDGENVSAASITNAPEKKMDSLRTTLDDRLKRMTDRLFGGVTSSSSDTKEMTPERKKRKQKRDSIMEEVLMEEEALAELINVEMKGKMVESVDDEEINYERTKIRNSRNSLMEHSVKRKRARIRWSCIY